MVINIKGTEIELTEALKQYATEKANMLKKFFDNIQQADIDIGMRNQHRNKGKIYYAEFNLHIPNKIIRVSKDSEDLYKAIDKVKDHLKVELEKAKEKMRVRNKEEIRNSKSYQI